MPKYEVAIVVKHLINFIVEADNEEEAEEVAKDRYHADDEPDRLGNEWAEIAKISVEPLNET